MCTSLCCPMSSSDIQCVGNPLLVIGVLQLQRRLVFPQATVTGKGTGMGTCMPRCTYVDMCTCMFVHEHTHTRAHTYIHTYIHTHIYISTSLPLPFFIHSLFRSYIHSTCTIFTDVFVFVFLEAGSRLESAVQMLHKSSVALLFLVPGMALKLMSNAAVACIRRSFRDELKVSVCQRFRRTLWQFTLTWRAKMRQQQTTRRAMSKRCEKDYNSLCDV